MWVFLNNSMLSIVANRANPGVLLVRARSAGDIERVFPDAEVSETPTADYRYRAEVLTETVAEALAAEVRAIDYPNFKTTVRDADRLRAYHDVWDVMARFQEFKHPRHR
jgi:hypothetical protein